MQAAPRPGDAGVALRVVRGLDPRAPVVGDRDEAVAAAVDAGRVGADEPAVRRRLEFRRHVVSCSVGRYPRRTPAEGAGAKPLTKNPRRSGDIR